MFFENRSSIFLTARGGTSDAVTQLIDRTLSSNLSRHCTLCSRQSIARARVRMLRKLELILIEGEWTCLR